MKMKYKALFCIMAVLLLAGQAFADSLAAGSSAENASIFAPRVARNVGDIVTITLSETATSSITLTNKMEKNIIQGRPSDSHCHNSDPLFSQSVFDQRKGVLSIVSIKNKFAPVMLGKGHSGNSN